MSSNCEKRSRPQPPARPPWPPWRRPASRRLERLWEAAGLPREAEAVARSRDRPGDRCAAASAAAARRSISARRRSPAPRCGCPAARSAIPMRSAATSRRRGWRRSPTRCGRTRPSGPASRPGSLEPLRAARPRPTPGGVPRRRPPRSISSPWCAERTDARSSPKRSTAVSPIRCSTRRRCSSAVMDAMARPGTMSTVGRWPCRRSRCRRWRPPSR